MKKCKFCNKEFNKDKTPRKFCSTKCRNLSYLKDPQKTWKLPKPCKYCNNIFVANNSIQYLCSKDCATAYNSFEYQAENGGVNKYHKIRFAVFQRDNFTCTYCGRNVKEDKIKLNIDHIKPKSMGGLLILSNLVTSCYECNSGKGKNPLWK